MGRSLSHSRECTPTGPLEPFTLYLYEVGVVKDRVEVYPLNPLTVNQYDDCPVSFLLVLTDTTFGVKSRGDLSPLTGIDTTSPRILDL